MLHDKACTPKLEERRRDGWTHIAYDANRNTVMEQTPSYTRSFDWDGRDMLVRVRSTEEGWTDNEIRYDGLAMRELNKEF